MFQELKELLFPNLQVRIEEIEARYPKRDLPKGAYVTRFAPSPTGYIHMGSLYASFISHQFARQTEGVFYLRIEDTDKKREIENGVQLIVDDLKRYQYQIDEGPSIGGNYGPYIQSERKEIYQVYVAALLEQGLAYPSFVTEEQLADIRHRQEETKDRIGYYGKWATDRNLSLEEVKEKLEEGLPYVIRLKSCGTYDKRISFIDQIKGEIEFPENDLDIVLLKADGIPTYHLAHAIDDHLMGTTHVIRGDEWLSSIPVHLQLFQVLGFKPPKYAHISPLTKKDGEGIRKLSKRKDPEATIHFYEELGVPIEAIQLYLATLMNANFEPWYLQNKEQKLNAFQFELRKMSSGGTLFDLEKLMNISKTYLSRMNQHALYEALLHYTQEYDSEFEQILRMDPSYAKQILNIEREVKRPRKDIGCYSDVKKQIWYFYDFYFEQKSEKYQDRKEYPLALIKEYGQLYNPTDSKEVWFEKLKELGKRFGYAKEVKEYKAEPTKYIGHVGDVCEMLRYVLTSQLQTPDLYEIMQVLGKETILSRIEKYCNL